MSDHYSALLVQPRSTDVLYGGDYPTAYAVAEACYKMTQYLPARARHAAHVQIESPQGAVIYEDGTRATPTTPVERFVVAVW